MSSSGKRAERKRRRWRRVAAPGAAPGEFRIDPEAAPTKVRVLAFGPEGHVEQELADLKRLDEVRAGKAVCWVNVDGLGDAQLLQRVADRFGLHRLALEDVIHAPQRAKFEVFDEHLFVILRMPHDEGGNGSDFEQVSLFIGEGWVLSFQERAGDCFNPVRERIRTPGRTIRTRGADYLGYTLIDAVIDAYFPLIEHFGRRLDELEDEVMERPTPETMARIHQMKRELVTLRTVAWPHRDAIHALQRDGSGSNPEFQPDTLLHLRDCYDHAIRIIDLIETQREVASDLMGTYLSSISNRMNEVMKVLTIIATIFIPLSFVAGLYGMNFDTASPWNMPELGLRFGYPLALGLMAGIGFTMLYWFWRKGWFD